MLDWLKDFYYITYGEVLGSRFWSLLLVFIISFIVILFYIASYIKKISDLNDEEKRWQKLSFGFGLLCILISAFSIWGTIIFDATADMMNNPFKAIYGQLKDKIQVSETVEVVKSKTLDIVDKASEEVVEVKEATAEKIGKIIQDTSEEFTELKDATSAKLQDLFKQKEAPFEAEYVEEDEEVRDLLDVIAYEEQRKAGILALSEKYNQNGQLNSQVIDALASDTSVESFKDIVLEVLAKAPASSKLEKNVNNNN